MRIIGLLNSSLTALLIELNGRSNLGQGALDLKVYEAKSLLIPNPHDFVAFCRKKNRLKEFKLALQTLLKRNIEPINVEITKEDKKTIDSLIFDYLGINEMEKNEFYKRLVELVTARLTKGNSFKKN